MNLTTRWTLITGFLGIGVVIYALHEAKSVKEEVCQAVQDTIIEESDLIVAAKMQPGDKLTNRWKTLMKVCS